MDPKSINYLKTSILPQNYSLSISILRKIIKFNIKLTQCCVNLNTNCLKNIKYIVSSIS